MNNVSNLIRFLKRVFHFIEALVANIFYNFPSRHLTVIGVTGTDGKTTTTHLIYHILKQAGKKVSMISSIYADIGGDLYDTGFHVTTPRAWILQKMLYKALKKQTEYFIIETTSHALSEFRVLGVRYKIGVITNVTQDHLYHHKTFYNYLTAKTKLPLNSECALLNYDDPSFEIVKKILDKKKKPFKTFSKSNKMADYVWSYAIKTKYTEDFNKENIMAAYSVCKELGLPEEKILSGIKTFTLPRGRLEIVYNKDFTVIIDFAHTPNSFKHLLKTLKERFREKVRIIHVFGAASERDDSKRPLMGEISGTYSDIVILTEEDYRFESLNKICSQIAMGLRKKGFIFAECEKIREFNDCKVYTIIKNRDKAIQKAIEIAKKGDIVLCTGKSHEKSLNRKGVEYFWDEYEAVRQAIEKKRKYDN